MKLRHLLAFELRARAALGLALLVAGCDAPVSTLEYRLSVRVQGDPGIPITGAKVLRDGTSVGTSNAEGLVTLAARGKEGSVMSFQVSCPEGYRSPSLPLSVVLRKVTERDRHPEYVVSCPPTMRSLVVAVRAEQGANLPVRYLGREVGRTDSAGSAHVLLRSKPEDTVELTLDTSDNPRLRPRSPSARFRIGQADDLVAFNQSFELEAQKRVFRRGPSGPVRIR